MADEEAETPAESKGPTAYERALRLLTRRAYSERELFLRLKRYEEYRYPEIRSAIENCRKQGFLNDELLAEEYARSLSERNCGSRKIRFQLKKRGLAENLVQNALESTAENEVEAAKRAAGSKLRLLSHETDLRKKREKLFRHLAARGFSFEVIRQAIEQIAGI